ncbi:hypothetical protein A0H81_06744 [Grifola frondosa]|uniref:N-acetyltransferase domain-containing protein n=1 Tax=Grifola frondosa TaxID=5627 RepID=A0A1C7M863_GRIFR|nr:hypothetical protein A0H81_06744 [Grifola frondosa]
MSFVNAYKPPSTPSLLPLLPESELYGPGPYDINFAYPLHAESLESARVKLTPFVPAEHASTYWAEVRRDPHAVLFAVIDKTRADPAHPHWGGSLAGVMGLYNTAPQHLSTEIAFVVVFPAFQRTHVATNAVGLLLRYTLQLPHASPPGLGFRRVQWAAHPANAASIGLAKRMGLKEEGVIRWMWVLPNSPEKEGNDVREGDAFSGGRADIRRC